MPTIFPSQPTDRAVAICAYCGRLRGKNADSTSVTWGLLYDSFVLAYNRKQMRSIPQIAMTHRYIVYYHWLSSSWEFMSNGNIHFPGLQFVSKFHTILSSNFVTIIQRKYTSDNVATTLQGATTWDLVPEEVCPSLGGKSYNQRGNLWELQYMTTGLSNEKNRWEKYGSCLLRTTR